MAESHLLIRFRGICGHIDIPKRRDGPEKLKRTVLVRHRNGGPNIEHHIPYIEFYAADALTIPNDLKAYQYTRPGMDGMLARVELEEGTEIRLKGVPAGEVEAEPSYLRDIPRMSQIIGDVEIAKSLLVENANSVDRGRAVAVFDMPSGRLVGGEPEASTTRFGPGIKFEERRLARWTDLHIAYDTAPLCILLVPFGDEKRAREITFKKTLRMITIGNEPERLILGVIASPSQHSHDPNTTPVQPTGHFILYYNLLENPPENRPVPIPTQINGPGCPNNAYP